MVYFGTVFGYGCAICVLVTQESCQAFSDSAQGDARMSEEGLIALKLPIPNVELARGQEASW